MSLDSVASRLSSIRRIRRCIEATETDLAIMKVSLRQFEKGERMGPQLSNVVSSATSIGTQMRVVLRAADEIK